MLSPHQRQLAHRVQKAHAVLATDLDGTFLGGSQDERAALYDYLRQQTHTALIFVTGRDAAHVRYLIEEEGVPRPQFIIGDVGTSVFDGHNFAPVAPLEAWIDSHWQGDATAQQVLAQHEDHLTLQGVYGGRRRSYFISDVHKAHAAKAAVEDAGYDAIVSDDTFFDVLPRGIQKGPTLLKLIEMLDIRSEAVLAAGDTLNDLSLFHTGLNAVAVGNREPALEAALPDAEHIFKASAPGAAGITQALHYFQLTAPMETA
ncbi:MAG: HAD family hydrolase [Pseudomonadota bacterium]